MNELYRELILDHYKNPRNYGELKKPDCRYSLFNTTCGDRIKIEIKIKNQKSKIKRIKEIKFTAEGCALSVASASLLTEKVKGMELSEVMQLKPNDVIQLLGISLTPMRLKCVLLPLEAIQKTLVLYNKELFGL